MLRTDSKKKSAHLLFPQLQLCILFLPCNLLEMKFLFCSFALLQAHSAYRGIGIVKLMGRSSGFIAMQASLASGQIDICLIPEVCLIYIGCYAILFLMSFSLDHILFLISGAF